MSIFSAPSFYGAADRAIYDAGNFFIPQEQFRGAFTMQTPPATATSGAAATTGINTVLNQGGGGGGNPFTGGISDLTGDFRKTVDDRQANLAALIGQTDVTGPDAGFYVGEGMDVPQGFTLGQKIQNFAYDNIPFINRPQTAEQILAKGYQQGSTLPGLSGFLNSISRFNELPRGDQAFIARNTGYRGPTVFGENTGGGNVDPFGLNVTSGFGNYAEAVEKQVDRLDDYFGGEKFDKKYGEGTTLEFDEETGQFRFVGTNAARANEMNKMNLARYNFYKQQVEQRDNLRRQEKERQAAELAAARARAQQEIAARGYQDYGSGGGRDESLNTGVGGSYSGRGDQGATGANFSGDFATDSASYDLAEGGRVGYMGGGLTDLVDIYD